MATTPQPLVWDYYRTVDGANNIGGVVHYYDEMSQSLWLSSGLHTDVTEVPEGHWKNSEWTNDITITEDEGLTKLRLDHPSNGILYGVTTDGNSLTFLRYIYGMDISSIIKSWSWTTKNDNAISQFNGRVMNIDPDIFTNESSLFQPGHRVSVNIYIGDSNAFTLCIARLDETDYDVKAETVDISGRNYIGYLLKDQTFDAETTFEDTIYNIITSILDFAGVTKYKVQPIETTGKFSFKPSDTLLNGIETILDYYTTTDEKLEIIELHDGTICIGYDYWVSEYLPRTYYSFNELKEVFTRKTTRSADSAYSKLYVTGQDANGNNLEPVIVDVDSYKYWELGAHRTKHMTAPEGFDQAGLTTWANTQAKIMQYVGIGESFSGPFRPQLVVGDIAETVRIVVGTSLGIINQVKHAFDYQNGYITEFTVDSGGVYESEVSTMSTESELSTMSVESESPTSTRAVTVYPRSAKVNGFNRKQSLVDLVKYTAEKTNSIDNITAKDVGAEPVGTSRNMISQHNEDSEAHSDIRSLLPAYTSADYGKVLSCTTDGFVWVTLPTTSDVPDGDNTSY